MIDTRIYSEKTLEIWGRDIYRANNMIETDSAELVKLDPEDFLDLVAGRWHQWPKPYKHGALSG